MYDKNGKLIPEKGDLSKETLKHVWQNGINNSLAQTERRILTSQRLKQIRTDCKLTQKELCEKIDLVLTTYAGYEQGRHDIPTEMIARIAKVCNVSADYIICLTDNPKGLFAEQLEAEAEKAQASADGAKPNKKRRTDRAAKIVAIRRKGENV